VRRTFDARRVARTLGLAVIGAAALLAGPLAGKSYAGTYTASECANSYSQAQYGEWGHHMLVVVRSCGNGGDGLGIALPQAYWAAGAGRWTTYAPPGTHIVSLAGSMRGVSADGWWAQLGACTPVRCDNAGPFNFGTWQGFGFGGGGYTNWWVQLVCVTGSCYGSAQSGAYAKDVTMVMYDDASPTVEQGGELLSAEVQRGTGRLDVTSTDVGTGLTAEWVLVNDQEIARQSYSCGGPPMQPCLSSGTTLHFDLDTQSSPFHDGANTVRTCAADYGAPPNLTCSPERVVNVDNSCAATKVPGGSDLSATFGRSKRDSVYVKPGQGALLTGKLTDSSGEPIPAAHLCMKEAVAGQALEGVGTVRTNPDGRYRYGVAPGPNRNLEIGYRYNRKQIERRARFFSKLRPRLKLSPKRKTRNGRKLRLYGSIPGPSNSDRVVILQARYPHSKRWSTFAKAKTDAHGAYSARYRFTATFVTTRYGMRAVVPEQNGYPYEGGASRVRKIEVVGRALGR
jgi:hypothetical protein